jgi:hypothetical protein
MGAGSAGPLVRRGDSAVQEHAYGVERRRYRLGLPPSFPSVGLRFPFIDRNTISQPGRNQCP